MTAVAMPERRWADAPVPQAPAPRVLVSSRDRAEVPQVAGALRLQAAARSRGWTAAQAYALADVPAGWTSSRGRAHRLASVSVRLCAPDGQRAWAVWCRVNGGPWRFAGAFVGVEKILIRALMKRINET